MGRNYFLAVSILICTGCMEVDIPLRYWISNSCSNHDKELIKKGAETWNKAVCMELFIYEGNFRETFYAADLNDQKLVVYCLEKDKINGIDVEVGNSLGKSVGDIFLWNKKIRKYVATHVGMPTGDEAVQSIAAHEFGHRLRFGHEEFEKPYTIMNAGLGGKNDSLVPSKFDIFGSELQGGLCDWIDCGDIANCPTAPKK